jgi:hypothetical protein
MKQRQSLLSQRADLPTHGRLRGMVTVVQEDRFRLQDDIGRGYLLTLGRGNGVGLRNLHTWCDRRATVEVEYRGAPDLGAVAVQAREVASTPG